MKYLSVIIFLYVTSCGKGQGHSAFGHGIIECEPKDANKWISHYNLSTATWTKNSIRFRQIYNNTGRTAYTDDKGKVHNVQPFVTGFFLYRVPDFRAFRKYKTPRLYNFYHGDTVKIYEINPKTSNLTITSLGFHTNRFFKAITPGVWFSVIMESHQTDDFALLGATSFHGVPFQPPTFAKRVDLLQKYPQHKSVIIKYTDEE